MRMKEQTFSVIPAALSVCRKCPVTCFARGIMSPWDLKVCFLLPLLKPPSTLPSLYL